jgi:hypothetical protein
MQPTDKSKQLVNGFEATFRPIGPRDLLAAALAMRAPEQAKKAAHDGKEKSGIRVA